MPLKQNLAICICLSVILAAESLTVKHQAAAQTSVPTTPTVVPSQQNMVFAGVGDVTFLDAQHGWMIAGYQQLTPNYEGLDTLDATTDGGRTWQTRSVLCPSQTKICPANRGNYDPALSLRFVNTQDGWVFGPGLFATHDGGVTWQQENISGDVTDLTIAHGVVEALQTICTATEPVHCTYAILRSIDNGQTWQTRPLPSAIIDISNFIPLDSQNLFFFGYDGNSNLRTFSSQNGGFTWESKSLNFPDRCSNLDIDLAVVDKQNLWLVCTYLLGAGNEFKWVYTSSDGGVSWQLKAQASDTQSDGGLDSLGYLDQLYAFSAQSAWMTFKRAPPLSTNDGGKTWHDINATAIGDTETGLSVIRIDDQHIWVYERAMLLKTSDGGRTWVCQRVNQGYADGAACDQGATDPRNATPYPLP